MSGAGLPLRGRSGQMTVELAVMTPVVIVVVLIVLNLMGFIEACAAFDQAALDAVISHGVAPAGEQTQIAAVDEVRTALVEALGLVCGQLGLARVEGVHLGLVRV